MKKGRKWSPGLSSARCPVSNTGAPPPGRQHLRKSSGVPLHMWWGGGHVTGPRTPPGHCLTDAPPRRHLLQTRPGSGSMAVGSLPSRSVGTASSGSAHLQSHELVTLLTYLTSDL